MGHEKLHANEHNESGVDAIDIKALNTPTKGWAKSMNGSPPGGEVEGDIILVSSPASGLFTGHAWEEATYHATGWTFRVPVDGWTYYVKTNNFYITFDSTGLKDPPSKWARTWAQPTSHVHGNVTNDGKIGSTANLPLKTGTAGVVEAGVFGTGATQFCEGNDGRLSDPRTPTAHNHAGADINSGTIDGDRLPAFSTTKKAGVPATGTPSGKYLKDDGTWATVTGGTKITIIPSMASEAYNQGNGTTAYYHHAGFWGTENNAQIRMCAGTLKRLDGDCRTYTLTGGGSPSATINIRKNGTLITGGSLVITGTGRYAISGLSEVFADGDLLSIRVVTTGNNGAVGFSGGAIQFEV